MRYIIATVGGFLLVTGGDLRTLTPETPNFLGYLFALLTPILWAIYTISTKKYRNQNLISLLLNILRILEL